MLLPWALLLGPAVAGPAYWWVHVLPAPGEPHGLQTLRPAHAWSRPAKAWTGAGALLTLLFMAGWMAWVAAFFLDGDAPALAVPVFAAFGAWTLVACAVLALFFLDALRVGGTHALL